tara:strand:+ start:3673 stop:3942 length:270 start_codon:yes stop_codon:yes gene_type:complete
MKQEDFKNAPKAFCENINLAFTPEYFVLGLFSGTQGSLYTLTPQHAKRLHQYLGHQIEEFEKKHHEIDAKWDPKIVSPVQRANPPTDLS